MRWMLVALLVAVGPHGLVLAQTATHESPAHPAAITGIATSARHCVSGNAANVHPLGWVAAQSEYTVQFDADFTVVAKVVRFEPSERRASLVAGTPELNFLAANSGTMVLLVTGNGQSGCYRYRAAIDPPAASVVAGARAVPALERPGAPIERRSASDAQAITGAPSSAQHCVAGNLVANVHEVGRVDQQSRFTVTFDADFNAVVGATMTSLEPNAGAGSFVVNADSGGSRNPSLSFTAGPGDNVVLYVASFNGAAGCYKYKVEIR